MATTSVRASIDGAADYPSLPARAERDLEPILVHVRCVQAKLKRFGDLYFIGCAVVIVWSAICLPFVAVDSLLQKCVIGALVVGVIAFLCCHGAYLIYRRIVYDKYEDVLHTPVLTDKNRFLILQLQYPDEAKVLIAILGWKMKIHWGGVPSTE